MVCMKTVPTYFGLNMIVSTEKSFPEWLESLLLLSAFSAVEIPELLLSLSFTSSSSPEPEPVAFIILAIILVIVEEDSVDVEPDEDDEQKNIGYVLMARIQTTTYDQHLHWTSLG